MRSRGRVRLAMALALAVWSVGGEAFAQRAQPQPSNVEPAPSEDGWGEDPAERELRDRSPDRRSEFARQQERLRRREERRLRQRRDHEDVKPRTLPEVDRRIAIGGSFIGIGLALFATGGGVYGASLNDGERCGLSGCVTTIDHGARLAGESLMIGSAVMTAGALPVLLTGLLDNDRQIHHSEGELAAGASLTLLGVGVLTSGVSALALEQRDRQGSLTTTVDFFEEGVRTDAEPWGAASVALGGVMTAIGVPLWLDGGRKYQLPLHQTPRLGQAKPQPMLPVQAAPEVAAAPGGVALHWRLH